MEQLDFYIREDNKIYNPVTLDSVYYVFADESYNVRHMKIPHSFVLVSTLNGSGQLNIGDKSFNLNSGDVLIFDASKKNFNYFCTDIGWNFWWFEFIVYDKDFFALPLNKVFSHPLNEDELKLCSEALLCLKLKNSKTSSILFSSLLCLLEKDSFSHNWGNNSADIFKSADEYIRRNLETVTVKDIAQELNISERTLLNVFRKKLNISTVNYITRIKTDMARHMLLTTDLSVKKIAASLGYNDQFIFSYAFKQRFNLSPKQYRQKYMSLYSEDKQ